MTRVMCLSACVGMAVTGLGCGPKDDPNALVGRPPTQTEVTYKQRVNRIKIESSSRFPATIQEYEEAVTKVFERNLPTIQECAQHVMVTHRTGIYVQVELTLNPDGFAQDSVLTTQDSQRDARAISCLEGYVLSWEYPVHPKQQVSTQRRVVHLVNP